MRIRHLKLTPGHQPILEIWFNLSSSINLIFRPSMAIIFSAAKLDKVRMAFDVVMFDRLAKSSRDKYMLSVDLSSSNP